MVESKYIQMIRLFTQDCVARALGGLTGGKPIQFLCGVNEAIAA